MVIWRTHFSMIRKKKTRIGDLLTELINREEVSRPYPTGLALSILMVLATMLLSVVVSFIVSEETRRNELDSLHQAAVGISRQVEDTLTTNSIWLKNIWDQENPHLCSRLEPFFSIERETMEVSIVDRNMVVSETCVNPNAMGDITRPVGARYFPDKTQSTAAKAKSIHTALYTRPFLSSAIGGPFTDLVIPLNQSGRVLIARISLPTLLQEIARNKINTYQRLYLIDGTKIYARTKSGEQMPGLENFPVRVALPPLPKSVELGLASSVLSTIHTNKVYSWCALALIFFICIFSIYLLRLQIIHNRIEREMQARVLVQEAISRSFRDGLCVLDKKGKILYTNAAFNSLLSIGKNDYLGKTPPYPFWPDNHTELLQLVEELLTGNKRTSITIDFPAKRSDGSTFDCHLNIFPLIRNKHPIGFMATHTDVTLSNRIDQELRAMQQRFKLVFEAMDTTVSVVTTTPPNQLLFANSHYNQVFGNSPEKHLRLIELIRQSSPDASEGTVYDETTQRWHMVRFKPLIWIDNQSATVLSSNDVTEDKLTEEAVKEQLHQAELSATLINMGEMASSLAHELNQPLAAIQNYASATKMMLEKNRLTKEENAQALEKIIIQTQRAASLMHRIRSFVKRAEPILVPVHTMDLVDASIEITSATARKQQVSVIKKVHEPLPMVQCDLLLIEQVLINLIKNAIEASAGIENSSVILEVFPKDKVVQFNVIDQGKGINLDVADKIFMPFFSTKSEGMGIGLNLCRSIIESHHGHLIFMENPDQGLTFSFTLPIVE